MYTTSPSIQRLQRLFQLVRLLHEALGGHLAAAVHTGHVRIDKRLDTLSAADEVTELPQHAAALRSDRVVGAEPP